MGCGSGRDEILLDEQEGSSAVDEADALEDFPEVSEVPEMTQEPQEIFVDVCGAVNHPGVYEMSSDSRVFQAIEAAGGMREDASGISVNQAQPLCDGQQVYVPTVQEAEERNLTPVVSEIQDGQTGTEMDAGTGLVNLNTADIHLRHCPASEIPRHRRSLLTGKNMEIFPVLRRLCRCPGLRKVFFLR